MKLFRLSTLMAVTCAAVSGALLFSTAQKVQQADQEMRRVQSRVTQEEQTIRVLRAEWDYLNRPDRLEKLVRTNLDLEQARPESVRDDASELPAPLTPIIPARKPAFSAPPSYSSVVKAIPAALAQPSPASLSVPPRPAAPLSPEKSSEAENNFKKLLNELAPAGGGE